MRGWWGMDLRGYFGTRGSLRVFGRWKETDVFVLRLMVEEAPFKAAFLAVFAFESFDSPAFPAVYRSKSVVTGSR
jgi:hypothetical protein